MYTLEKLISLARLLEPNCAAAGWHVAIAGGALMRGASAHDFDIVAFPHDRNVNPIGKLREAIAACGLVLFKDADDLYRYRKSKGEDPGKHVDIWHWRDSDRTYRVDVVVPTAGPPVLFTAGKDPAAAARKGGLAAQRRRRAAAKGVVLP